jgi:hypothetical protein
MTEKPQHTALVAAAALTALLAKHPELAEAVRVWSYDHQAGLNVGMGESVDDLAPFEQLAAVVGGHTITAKVFEHDGERFEPHYLQAELAGIPLFFGVHLRVEPDGGAS